MKKLIILAASLLITSPAMAGWCNQIGQVTQCFSDNGTITNINPVGSMALTNSSDKRGNQSSESYQVYGGGGGGLGLGQIIFDKLFDIGSDITDNINQQNNPKEPVK
jgi:hypothetical protein